MANIHVNGTRNPNISTGNTTMPKYVGARAYVEQTEDGAVVTVIDKDGTTSAVIKDGKDGIDGKDGEDGKSGTADVKVLNKVHGTDAADYSSQMDGDGIALLDNSDFGFASIQEAINIGTGPASGASFGTSGQNGIALADGGIILIKFTSDVGASSVLTLGYDAPGSSGAIPIYYNGSAISAGIIKANDVVALQYDDLNNRWHLINRIMKQFGSATEGIVPACGVPMSDELRILTSSGWQTIVTYGSYLSLDDFVQDVLLATFDGATSSAAGSKGLVPAPASGATKSFLLSDGTWNGLYLHFIRGSASDNITLSIRKGDSTGSILASGNLPAATQVFPGLMSAADKAKLDSITMTDGKIDISCLPCSECPLAQNE